MLQTSKDLFELVLADVEEFKINGQLWCDDNDEGANLKARMIGKKLVKNIRTFAATSITEAKEFAKATIAEKPVVEEVVEAVEESVETTEAAPVGEVHVQ